MQTFLPYPDFVRSAECLDVHRLGKQRVETLQIMNALLLRRGWIHHPATNMWRGYERALLQYQTAVCNTWTKRGYADTCLPKTIEVYSEYAILDDVVMPYWFGNPDFHRSHQSNLVRKKPEHYSKFFPDVPPNLPYMWPRSE